MNTQAIPVLDALAPPNGAQLRSWRLDEGLTQVQAARQYGVCERQWRRYEAEDSPVPKQLVHWQRIWETVDRLSFHRSDTGVDYA